jgi:hypothetical protein
VWNAQDDEPLRRTSRATPAGQRPLTKRRISGGGKCIMGLSLLRPTAKGPCSRCPTSGVPLACRSGRPAVASCAAEWPFCQRPSRVAKTLRPYRTMTPKRSNLSNPIPGRLKIRVILRHKSLKGNWSRAKRLWHCIHVNIVSAKATDLLSQVRTDASD